MKRPEYGSEGGQAGIDPKSSEGTAGGPTWEGLGTEEVRLLLLFHMSPTGRYGPSQSSFPHLTSSHIINSSPSWSPNTSDVCLLLQLQSWFPEDESFLTRMIPRLHTEKTRERKKVAFLSTGFTFAEINKYSLSRYSEHAHCHSDFDKVRTPLLSLHCFCIFTVISMLILLIATPCFGLAFRLNG